MIWSASFKLIHVLWESTGPWPASLKLVRRKWENRDRYQSFRTRSFWRWRSLDLRMSRLLLVCGRWSLALQSTMHAASFESPFRMPNWSTPFSSTSRRTGNGTAVLASSSLVFRHRDRKGRTIYIT